MTFSVRPSIIPSLAMALQSEVTGKQ
jgi:hypothetical protein